MANVQAGQALWVRHQLLHTFLVATVEFSEGPFTIDESWHCARFAALHRTQTVRGLRPLKPDRPRSPPDVSEQPRLTDMFLLSDGQSISNHCGQLVTSRGDAGAKVRAHSSCF